MVFRRRTKAGAPEKAGQQLPSLSDREFLILRALQGNLRQGLYGIEIRDITAEEFGITLPWGSLYVMLGRLVEKGFADRLPGAGPGADIRRQYYRLNAQGQAAVVRKQQELGVVAVPGGREHGAR